MPEMVLERPQGPLTAVESALPRPAPHQVLLRVLACGVCRTDLHIVDGELTDPRLRRCFGGQLQSVPAERLDATLVFALLGFIPQALQLIRPARVVVCGGIHMSDIPSFSYPWLCCKRAIRSVANPTRRDGVEFWQLADRAQLRGTTVPFALSDTNAALTQFRREKRNGAAVLVPAQIGIRESCVMS